LPVINKLHKMGDILDDLSGVTGIIYCVTHIPTGKKYVGQTRSHRLNHGRYRPFGAEGRFRDHLNVALKNTKSSQCSALYNAIRLDGREAFTIQELESCCIELSDERERHWIGALNTGYPNGYNLTEGGCAGGSVITHVGIDTPLNPVGKRGGSIARSVETRTKMSERSKAFSNLPQAKEERSKNAAVQHAAEKVKRFAGVTMDATNLDQYIYTKGVRVFVRVNGIEASFAGVNTTQSQNIERAKEFLTSLTQIATLPNCSGNP